MINLFEESVEIDDPENYGDSRRKIEVSLHPIGPALLGDFRLLMGRGCYGSPRQKFFNPERKNYSGHRIVTFPELILFLDRVKKDRPDLYSEFTKLPTGEYNPEILRKGRDAFKCKFLIDEEEVVGNICGDTVFYDGSGRDFIVQDHPDLYFDKACLIPIKKNLDSSVGRLHNKSIGRVSILEIEGCRRIIDICGYGGKLEPEEVLNAFTGNTEISGKARNLEAELAVNPSLSGFRYEGLWDCFGVVHLTKANDSSYLTINPHHSFNFHISHFTFLARNLEEQKKSAKPLSSF